mgnify:CR=1
MKKEKFEEQYCAYIEGMNKECEGLNDLPSSGNGSALITNSEFDSDYQTVDSIDFDSFNQSIKSVEEVYET